MREKDHCGASITLEDLLEVLVKQGRSLTEGTASSIRGYDLMNVSISSGN